MRATITRSWTPMVRILQKKLHKKKTFLAFKNRVFTNRGLQWRAYGIHNQLLLALLEIPHRGIYHIMTLLATTKRTWIFLHKNVTFQLLLMGGLCSANNKSVRWGNDKVDLPNELICQEIDDRQLHSGYLYYKDGYKNITDQARPLSKISKQLH